MSYSKKHKTEKVQKPPCYGDPDEYAKDDPDCRRCRFQNTCRAIVNRKLRREREDEEEEEDERPAGKSKYRKNTQRPSSVPVDPDPESYEERDEEPDSFWTALAANGALSAMRAGLVEATFAIDQIPRFPYPDPFRTAAQRGRRRAAETPEEEDE